MTAKQQKKTPKDPRTNNPPSQRGEGSNKRYKGTGQNRMSQRDFSGAQMEALRNVLMQMGLEFNDSRFPYPEAEKNYYQPEDLEAQLAQQQPSWQPDPWRMDSPRSESGGRGPAGLGNAESEFLGPGGGTLMDKLMGYPGAQRQPRNFRM